MDNVDHPKRTAAQRPEQRHSRHGPEDELEVEVVGDMGANVRLADRHSQDGIRHHPRHHHIGADAAVVVLLLLELRDAILLDLEPIAEVPERFVIARVDVELLGGHFELDGVGFGTDGGAEVGVDDVVALGAPGDVVGVAEGVDLERADVGGEEGKVLRGGGEHVPRVEVEEGH